MIGLKHATQLFNKRREMVEKKCLVIFCVIQFMHRYRYYKNDGYLFCFMNYRSGKDDGDGEDDDDVDEEEGEGEGTKWKKK